MLVAEDDFFLADDLKEHGASVVGPMASPSATLQALETEIPVFSKPLEMRSFPEELSGFNTPDRRSGVPRVNEPHT